MEPQRTINNGCFCFGSNVSGDVLHDGSCTTEASSSSLSAAAAAAAGCLTMQDFIGICGGGGGPPLPPRRRPQESSALFSSSPSLLSPEASMLAKDMEGLSMKERKRVFDDLSGIKTSCCGPTIETNCLLNDFQKELERLVNSSQHYDTTGYEQALQINPDYVSPKNTKLRLYFLRHAVITEEEASSSPTVVVIVAAVQRFLRFLNEKLILFGTKLLCQEFITYHDLDHETQQFVQSGSMQIIGKDQSSSNRTILFMTPQFRPQNASIIASAKCHFYILMCAMQNDEITQQKGCVVIFYIVDQTPQILTSRQEEGRRLQIVRDAVPIRFSSLHICYNDPMIRRVAYVWLVLMGVFVRRRLCPHYGQHVECKYDLMAYGISPSIIPIDSTGHLQLEGHSRWMEQQQILESKSTSPFASPSLKKGERGEEIVPREKIGDTSTLDRALMGDLMPIDDHRPHDLGLTNANDDEQLAFHPVEPIDLKDFMNIDMEELDDQTFGELSGELSKATSHLPHDSDGDFDSMATDAHEQQSEVLSRLAANAIPKSPSLPVPLLYQSRGYGLLEKTLLPPSFTPSSNSVVLGRGTACANAAGTLRLGTIVHSYVEEYKNAQSREEKSAIVTTILDYIYETCPVGAVVRRENGQWWEVSERKAREKISAMFRNCLSEQYKSSTKNRVAHRRIRNNNASSSAV